MLRETCTLALLPMSADLSRDLAGDATLSAVSGLASPRAGGAIELAPRQPALGARRGTCSERRARRRRRQRGAGRWPDRPRQATGGVITFTLELSTSGRDTQIAAAGGAVGPYEARELERAIVAGIGQGRTRVVVDLTDVTEVGPGLLGILLRL